MDGGDEDPEVLLEDQPIVRDEERELIEQREEYEEEHHGGEERAVGDHLKAWPTRTQVTVRPSGLTGIAALAKPKMRSLSPSAPSIQRMSYEAMRMPAKEVEFQLGVADGFDS